MNATPVNFDGLKALAITTSSLRMVVVTELRPRIAQLSRFDDENLFYWKRDDVARDDWRLWGGHRVWAADTQNGIGGNDVIPVVDPRSTCSSAQNSESRREPFRIQRSRRCQSGTF